MDNVISGKGAFGEWADATAGDRVTAALDLFEMSFAMPSMGVEPTLATPPVQTPMLVPSDGDRAIAFVRAHWQTLAIVAIAGVAVGGWSLVLVKHVGVGFAAKHAAALDMAKAGPLVKAKLS